MFSTQFNPIKHFVTQGQCQSCHQVFTTSRQGIVYTKEGAILTFTPERSEPCTTGSKKQ